MWWAHECLLRHFLIAIDNVCQQRASALIAHVWAVCSSSIFDFFVVVVVLAYVNESVVVVTVRTYQFEYIFYDSVWKWTMNGKNKQIKAFKPYYNLCPIYLVPFFRSWVEHCFVQFSIPFLCLTLSLDIFHILFTPFDEHAFFSVRKIFDENSRVTFVVGSFFPLSPLIPDCTSYFYFILTKCQNVFCPPRMLTFFFKFARMLRYEC